jgi:hypothetical protein
MSGSELRLCLFVGLREFVAHAAEDDRGFYSARYSYRGGRQNAAVHGIHHRQFKHGSDVERGWWSFQRNNHEHRSIHGADRRAKSSAGYGYRYVAGG